MTRQQTVDAKAELNITPSAEEVFGRRYPRFIGLVGDLRQVNEMKKEAEAESKRINDELQLMWADVEHKTVTDTGTKITLVSSSNSSISKEKLVELGVPAETVLAATKVTPYQYVLVTVPKS
jgi:hypothetical protein